MRYEILGPLRVIDSGHSRALSARKVEIVLAALLIRSDRVVAASELMTELWGESLPRRAAAGVHVYISELRKFLRDSAGPQSPVITEAPGYMLCMGCDELDCHAFLRLMDKGREHVREFRDEEAARCFEEALALWRGPVLADLGDGPILKGYMTWLEEQRLEGMKMLIDAKLRLGCHRELVGWLYSVTSEYPLHEEFYRQLMLALYRSDRQADALAVYRSVRKLLRDELGLEPCQTLQDVQRAILAGEELVDACA
ncbi:AfsR/SARP family transcriptional regulator [Streptomyces sp. 7R007]